jgi:hypothetical protein
MLARLLLEGRGPIAVRAFDARIAVSACSWEATERDGAPVLVARTEAGRWLAAAGDWVAAADSSEEAVALAMRGGAEFEATASS